MPSTSEESTTGAYFVLMAVAIVIIACFMQDDLDRLGRRDDMFENRLKRLEARAARPKTSASEPERVMQTDATPPEVGAIVRFEPRRDAREMIVLKSTKHARGEGCVPELDDARLAVLDVRDGWVLVRYNRLGADGIDEPKTCTDGTVGAVSVEGFRSYQAEDVAPYASDRGRDAARAIQLFVSTP